MIGLPAYLKVRLDRIESKREHFTILEGLLQGIRASVTLDKQGGSYLFPDNPQTGQISMTYSIAKKTLQVRDKTYMTTDAPDVRWKKGVYDVEIPDAPHHGGLRYPEARYARTWFRVGHSGDRYVHTGRHSLGCITVIERNRWDDLYAALIKARKGDGRSIGVLEVID